MSPARRMTVGLITEIEIRARADAVQRCRRAGPHGTGFGLGVAFGRIPSIAGPVLTGSLIGSVGLPTLAKGFAVLWLLYIAAFLVGPETRGRRLEELDAV